MAPTPLQIAYQLELVFVNGLIMFHIIKLALLPLASYCAQRGVGQVWASVRKRLCDCYRSASARLVRRRRKREKGAFAKAVQEQMDEFRVQQCQRCVRFFTHMLGVVMLLGSAYGQLHNVLSPSLGSVVRLGINILVYFVGLTVASGYFSLTKMRLDFLYAFISLTVCVTVAQMENDETFFLLLGANGISRIMLGILYLDFSKSVPWNVIISIVSCWRYPYNASLLSTAEHTVWYFVVLETFVCFGVCLVCGVVQTWLEGRFRLQLSVQSQKRATFRFATCQSDAVFWLAPDLRLSQPAPQLAHMLRMPEAHNYLDGHSFEDCIATDSDRDRFRSFLEFSTALEADDLPALLHVDLQDSTSRAFPVHVFHSWFVDDNDQVGHLIGVSESRATEEVHDAGVQVQEQLQHVQQQRTQPTAAATGAFRSSAVQLTAMGSQSINVDSIASAPAATGDLAKPGNVVDPSLMSVMPQHQALASVSVLIDAITMDLLGSTAGFAALVGPFAGATSIEDVLGDSAGFATWMQVAANSLQCSEHESKPLPVKLAQKRDKYSRRFQYSAIAHVRSLTANVCPSEMGVQLVEGCIDEECGLLCVIEFRSVEIIWPGQSRQRTTAARDPVSNVICL